MWKGLPAPPSLAASKVSSSALLHLQCSSKLNTPISPWQSWSAIARVSAASAAIDRSLHHSRTLASFSGWRFPVCGGQFLWNGCCFRLNCYSRGVSVGAISSSFRFLLGLVELQHRGVMICHRMWPCGQQFRWNGCWFRLNRCSTEGFILFYCCCGSDQLQLALSGMMLGLVELQSRGVRNPWRMWPCGEQFRWNGCCFWVNLLNYVYLWIFGWSD